MKNHYFCAFPGVFDRGCQVIPLRGDDVLWKVAERWMKANGYRNCYVYDSNHDFVWSFNLKKS